VPSVNPIIEGTGGPAAAPPSAHESGGSVPPTTGSVGGGGFGFPTLGNFSSVENTSSHVAILVVISLGIVAGLWYGGFSFGVDAGVTK